MNIEKEIALYLQEYGNTRESDMIEYGVRKFSYSPENLKKTIKRMVVKGKIHYVVHNKLEPPEVYISLKEPLPPEVSNILLKAFTQVREAEEDVQKILEEAATLAEQKLQEEQSLE